MSAMTTFEVQHDHTWRVAEVEFVDFYTLRRSECTCGAVDFAYAS